MLISTKAKYALKALVVLANSKAYPEGDGPILVRDLAKKSHVPAAFLGKIISEFSVIGLVTSRKGRGGGVELAKHPEDIVLGECVEPIDRIHGQNRCMLNPLPCRDSHPCPMHAIASKIRLEVFGKTTLAQISHDTRWIS